MRVVVNTGSYAGQSGDIKEIKKRCCVDILIIKLDNGKELPFTWGEVLEENLYLLLEEKKKAP
jgi:hypothetical protein